MSIHRRAAKRDQNESLIFAAFRAAGCSILPISAAGCPDAVIFCPALKGAALLIEVKARKGTLTEAQKKWRETWTGPQPHIVRDIETALKLAKG